MVIFKDKRFITNSEHPDDDFVGNADFVISDDSELAQEILALCPNFEFILNDDGTKIIDVVATEPVVTAEQIKAHKTKRIQESKILLAKWLNDNPILYTDGKYYSVTEEKQALLNGNLASYERAKSVGVEFPLKWNSTGSSCLEWEYNDLLTLSLTIAGYVAPKVAIQQNIELDIKACETIEDIDAVVIDYDEA